MTEGWWIKLNTHRLRYWFFTSPLIDMLMRLRWLIIFGLIGVIVGEWRAIAAGLFITVFVNLMEVSDD